MAHLFHATQREYQKMGKVLSAAELYGSQMDARAVPGMGTSEDAV
jgi:hypothetical protein